MHESEGDPLHQSINVSLWARVPPRTQVVWKPLVDAQGNRNGTEGGFQGAGLECKENRSQTEHLLEDLQGR